MLPVLHTKSPLSLFGGSTFNRLDTLFDRFFGDDFDVLGRQGLTWSHMPLAMWADDNHVYVEAELPGVEEKDLEVSVHGDVLSIKAERRPTEGRNYIYNGRIFGRFERAVALTEAVDTDQIEATLTNGVLHLSLPKKAEARTKKISVKTS
jgi:HSP20 family protein